MLRPIKYPHSQNFLIALQNDQSSGTPSLAAGCIDDVSVTDMAVGQSKYTVKGGSEQFFAPVVNSGTAGGMAASRKLAALITAADSDYLRSVSTDFELTNQSFSVGGWVKFTTVSAAMGIASKYVAGDRQFRLELVADNTLTFVVSDGTTNDIATATTTTTVTTATWYHVMAVFDYSGATAKIYLNGSVSASGTRTGDSGPSSTAFMLGNSASQFLDGALQCWGFWKRALSANEVLRLYNGGVPLAGVALPLEIQQNLMDYWDLDTFATTTNADRVGLYGDYTLSSINSVQTTPGHTSLIQDKRSFSHYNTNSAGAPTDALVNLFSLACASKFPIVPGTSLLKTTGVRPRLIGVSIAADGTVSTSSNHVTCALTSTSTYTITMTKAFARKPVAVAICTGSTMGTANVTSTSTTAVVITTYNAAGAAAAYAFHVWILGWDSPLLLGKQKTLLMTPHRSARLLMAHIQVASGTPSLTRGTGSDFTITDNGTGDFTLAYKKAFKRVAHVIAGAQADEPLTCTLAANAVGSCQINCFDNAGNATDPETLIVFCLGYDQAAEN